MAVCANCGTSNIDGTKFCVSCGAQLGEAPAPESWRASSELHPPADTSTPGATTTGTSGSATTGAGYTPQTPPSNYPTYTPPQGTQPYQPQVAGGAQPTHPGIAALISFFFPGLGLLLVPNKQGLGIGIFVGWIVLLGICILLTFVFIGLCLFLLLPLAHIAAAIHSWDEAAKASGGQFQPILFK
jgi:hypothetical protein